jgi:orotate phosphoribosyltransferase
MSGEGAEARAQRADRILSDSGAVLHGDHFVYINGDHGEGWLAKDLVFPHADRASELCGLLAETVADRDAQILCGPATGGLIVAMWTAYHLELPWVFAEHAKSRGYDPAEAHPGPLRPPFELSRGFPEILAGKRVLVVDDVVNTGESVAETAAAVRGAGGEVTAVGALCTRGNAGPGAVGADDFAYVTEVEIASWPASECDLCKRGVPINTQYAHGADYVAAQAARA